MASAPVRTYDPPAPAGSATIGKAVMIKGQIFSREDLVIDGEVEGTVEAQDHRVTVGPNGKVQAGVKAREIVVLGAIMGTSKRPTRSTSARMRVLSAISRRRAS